MATLSYTAAQIDALLAKADTIGDLDELETTDYVSNLTIIEA